MDTIKATLPAKPSECFFYVGPPPTKNKVDIPGRPMIFETENHSQPVILVDFITYPMSRLSAYHCYAAYGMSKTEMQNFLKAKFNFTDRSTVCFYLFRKTTATELPEQQQTKQTAQVPGLI